MLSLLVAATSFSPVGSGPARGLTHSIGSGPARQRPAVLSAANCETELPAGQRHFLHVDDLSTAEVREVLDLAKRIKATLAAGGPGYRPFADQTLAMVFTKPSCRTRVSFESGFRRLGGHALCLGEEVGIGTREATKDVARVLASMNELLMARLYAHADMLELAQFSKVPVVNGLTDYNHPCQIVADALTIEEVVPDGSIEGKKVVYVGDGNNIVHSWLELACVVPFDFVCACPSGFEPDAELVERVAKSGVGSARVVVDDPTGAVSGADVIYADVWASMGQKEEAATREAVFAPYQAGGPPESHLLDTPETPRRHLVDTSETPPRRCRRVCAAGQRGAPRGDRQGRHPLPALPARGARPRGLRRRDGVGAVARLSPGGEPHARAECDHGLLRWRRPAGCLEARLRQDAAAAGEVRACAGLARAPRLCSASAVRGREGERAEREGCA